MKKLLLTLAVAAAGVFGSQVQGATIEERLVFYIPNRIIDALDTFSVALGFGPTIEARLMATRAIDVGAGIGWTAKGYKIHNRQYGFGLEEGWYWSFICVGAEDFTVYESTPLVERYVETRVGFPEPIQRVYDFFEGPRDYWAFGGSLGLFLDGDLYVHPVELVDFVLGFFLLDIKDDDLTFDTFR